MKSTFYTLITFVAIYGLFTIISCGSPKKSHRSKSLTSMSGGKLKGIKYSPKQERVIDKNMASIPGGSFEMGRGDSAYNEKTRMVSVSGFYMDATEVTNGEYREFVNWVRDSLAAIDLGYYKVEETGDTTIDWKKAAGINYGDYNILSQLSSISLPPEMSMNNKTAIDPDKLIYSITGFDFAAAAKPENKKEPKSKFYYRIDVPIYPDTLVWMKDFKYANNQQLAQLYFSHPTYKNYPVVGVNWLQAQAFCHWRTKMLNSYLGARGKASEGYFRLPTEAEWELAARADSDSLFSWGSNSVFNETAQRKGSRRPSRTFYMANLKDNQGDYSSDGALFPARVDSYWPNSYGVYNIIGNVSEWTSSYFYPGSYEFQSEINPSVEIPILESMKNRELQKKVIKGGSWKDISHYMNPSTRTYEYMNESNSYTGFRCVITLSGMWQ